MTRLGRGRWLLLPLALLVAGWMIHRQFVRDPDCERCAVVRGGDAGRWPRATPEQEGLDASAAARVVDYARQQDADALLVARHGHLIVALEKTADRRIASHGLLSPLVRLTSAASAASAPNAAGLARELWQPLNALDARLKCGAGSGGDCALWARPGDWLRVGQLLLDGGRIEGEQLLDARAVAAIGSGAPVGAGQLLPAKAALGAEPLVDARGDFLRGEGRTRLWLAPSVGLVVLMMANDRPSDGFDETELPNMLVRGLRDRPAGSGAAAESADNAAALAPGHWP